jgi:predicted MPP superfamily phosphohydrolase
VRYNGSGLDFGEMRLFGTTLIIIGTVMHLYVFWRIWSLPIIRERVPWFFLLGVCAAIWVVFYLGRTYGHGGDGALARALEFVGLNWLAAVFLAFICVLPVDIVTAFGFLLSRYAPWLRGAAVAAGFAMAAIALVQGLRPPVISSYEVRMAGLPADLDGTVVVAMADTHVGSLIGERWLSARVRQVEAQNPDIIVLLGDMVEGHGGRQEAFVEALRKLSAPLGVWGVYGNHEGYGRGGGPSAMEEAGVEILHDRCVQVRPGLVLAGVDNLGFGRRPGGREGAVSRTLAGRPPGATILLSHVPWQYDDAAKAGVGLMLCGHTHAGQVWPFGEFERHVFPLMAGRYQADGMTAIVTRGAGTWGPRMRLWKPGEILRVTLRSAPGPREGGADATDGNVP